MTTYVAPTLNKAIGKHYRELEQLGKTIATYIWIDGTGEHLRGKSYVVAKEPERIEDLRNKSYDGSSTGQASGHHSDITIKPVALYRDPFLCGPNKLVLCDTYDSKGKPLATNRRKSCKEAMDAIKHLKPWFGLEQEYTLFDAERRPLGWPRRDNPPPQGPYYCGVGSDKMWGREICDSHLKACMYAGLDIEGTNAEVMPSQWEFQVGPVEGIGMGDQLWIARYILHRVAEDYGVTVSLDPKPMSGDWNGAGCHANFSTEPMRKSGGLKEIHKAIAKLEKRHQEHIRHYDPKGGEDNRRRLTGKHETQHIDRFSWGVADRGSSIRLLQSTVLNDCGYLEDRRPASNCDPYAVTELIVRTTYLEAIDHAAEHAAMRN